MYITVDNLNIYEVILYSFINDILTLRYYIYKNLI